MVWFKEKNASDDVASARLFDAETSHFYPTNYGSAEFEYLVVEISPITGGKRRQFCLNLQKFCCCTAQFPIESEP